MYEPGTFSPACIRLLLPMWYWRIKRDGCKQLAVTKDAWLLQESTACCGNYRSPNTGQGCNLTVPIIQTRNCPIIGLYSAFKRQATPLCRGNLYGSGSTCVFREVEGMVCKNKYMATSTASVVVMAKLEGRWEQYVGQDWRGNFS